MCCKDPLIEVDLPATKQSCGLPTQRDEHTKFEGQIKSPRCDFAKNVIVLLWVDDPGHKQDGSRQEPKPNVLCSKNTCSITTRLEYLDYLNYTYTLKSTGLRMRTHQEELAKEEIKGMEDVLASYVFGKKKTTEVAHLDN
nr:hypothetical protein CFP56_61597 [Quercus suber]